MLRTTLKTCLKLNFSQLNNINAISYNATVLSRCLHINRPMPKHLIKEKPALESTEGEDDRQYLVRLQNEPDVFGAESPHAQEEVHELDALEEDYLQTGRPEGRRLRTKEYADMIKALLRKRKLKEAIDVVEVKMLQEDKAKPENYLYNLLLGACGKVGYTKKAFQLFNDMKKRGLTVHPGAYTALFNACANSPFPEDGLERTKHLHKMMIEKQYEPNDSNYHAMIKAYGRCGDIQSAFGLVDEMFAKRFNIKHDTLNFLLQACISDKEAGFRHALLVWRKFLQKRIQPSVYSYNLLLRATRDCGLGDLESTKDVLKQILSPGDKFLRLSSGEVEEFSEKSSLPMPTEIKGGKFSVDDQLCSVENRPNLLAPNPHMGSIVELSDITRAEDRLLLLGGTLNFLTDMKSKDCRPDIKTYTQLIDCCPGSLTAEKEVLQAMQKERIVPDLDFFNMLMKKRSMRFDYASARDVLEMINKARYMPDVITYGILALGCKTKEEAENCMYEMESAKYRVNAEILGAMLQQSTYHVNFPYVMYVMEQCVAQNIQPNEKFMEHLDKFYKKCKRFSNNPECPIGISKTFQKGFRVFRMRLKTWKAQVTPEEQPHPWQQYKEPVETDVRHYKDKEASSRFKPRHKNFFRQKQPAVVSEKEKPPFWRRPKHFKKQTASKQISD